MSLRIGFDLDGVLADMDAELGRLAAQLFGSPPAAGAAVAAETPEGSAETPSDEAATPETATPDVPVSSLTLSPRQQRLLWRHVSTVENFWEGLAEIEPGITVRLAALAADRGWEIIFLTKRPRTAGVTSQVQSQRWLQSKGFPIPSVFVVQGSRGRIAASIDLDVVVDDRPENCLDVVVDSRARAVLVWRDQGNPEPPTVRKLGISTVRSVSEALDMLEALDAQTRAPKGVVARIKQMFTGVSGAAL